MVIELDDIISFFRNLVKPENLTLTSFLGLIPLIMYLLKRRTIPKLAFDGIWKEPTCISN